jgi:hypothetical protein
MYPAVLDMKTKSCPYYMKTLYTGRPGIYYQHIALGIPYNLKDMRMSAHKDIRFMFLYQFDSPAVISSRIASHMSHKNLQAFAFKETEQRVLIPQSMIIAIASDTLERLECRQFLSQRHAPAEITGMPQLIHRLQKIPERLVEYPMSV